MQDQAAAGHSVWLCAKAQMHEVLSAEITGLTRLSHTPSFEPHVTLVGDLKGDPHETATLCRAAFEAVGPIHAQIGAVVQTDAYYMSLFLDLDAPDKLHHVQAQIARDLGVVPPAHYCPHVSLAYGLGAQAVPIKQLKRLQSEYVGRQITLAQAVVVASAKGMPIDEWRRIVTIAL